MKKTIRDYKLEGKRVIIRCDFNVPMKDGIITDDFRIQSSLKTIKYAIEHQAKVILMSHLGKVKTEEDKEKNSLYPVSIRLSELLHQEVIFSKTTHSEELTNMVNNLKNGQVLLMENTRFEDIEGNKESGCDYQLSSYWASLGDIYILDAYGSSHRAHSSTVGIPCILDNGIGFLVEEEISKLEGILKEDTHPFIVIMGGKKIEDKIPITSKLIKECDKLLVGGGMAFTYLASTGLDVGKSIVDTNRIEFCRELLSLYRKKIALPKDVVVSKDINESAKSEIKKVTNIAEDEIGLDIGPETIEYYTEILKEAKRVIINGPMGVFEFNKYAKGTNAIYQVLKDNHIKTLIGGGDSSASVKKLGYSNDDFYHISTGGGATLEYLEGKELPGISVIEDV